MLNIYDIVVPDWLKRLALYAALAAALLATGYVKGCSDQRADFVQFKAKVAAAGEAQNKAAAKQAALDKADKEKRDAEYQRSTARLERDLQRLRANAGRGVLPAPSPEAADPSRITFDRAELDRALREFLGETAGLVGEGQAAIDGLDSLR